MWTQSGTGSGGVNWEKRIDIYILTLCDPVDHSPPGSSVHGILQARTVEWFLCPPPGDLPNPGTGPVSLMSPTLAGRFFTTSVTRCKTDSEKLLCNTGSSAWCSVGGMGSGRQVQEGGDICIHITDSLCCTAVTNTTL